MEAAEVVGCTGSSGVARGLRLTNLLCHHQACVTGYT